MHFYRGLLLSWSLLQFVLLVTLVLLLIFTSSFFKKQPDSLSLDKDLVAYGKDLIAHTSTYLGPNGTVMQISNGMNCQNCHLDAATRPFGNNLLTTYSDYPKFRARSGMVETIEKRINDCFERSLNGNTIPVESREMKAIVAYLKSISESKKDHKHVPKQKFVELSFLERPADPVQGEIVYIKHCQRCHGKAGIGKMLNEAEWKYPPLAGEKSYSTAAGIFRLSKFGAFVKTNMPYGVTKENALLTDEEAWDVAAYINSLPRPHKEFKSDWPDISKKPFDHPFGPYADTLSEYDHKYGPFGGLGR